VVETTVCLDDVLLVRKVQHGNAAAFEELVCHHDRAVLRLALHLTGSESDAQDLYQEALIKAYQKLSGFRFECTFSTWLYRIVTNVCLDYLRRSRKRKENTPVAVNAEDEEHDSLDQIPDPHAANPEQHLMNQQLANRIACALHVLTPRERTVFELKHYHGLPLRAAAVIQGITEGAAKTTLFRATQELRSRLAGLYAK
jgi:RNA polymerase sigma-70 factor (ECF subfamily)